MADEDEETVYDLRQGTLEEGRAFVGRPSEVRFGEVDVNWPMIKTFAAMAHDDNPNYWDEEHARSTWGGIISPPAMLVTWVTPIDWKPDGEAPEVLVTKVPLPGDTMINVSTEIEFFEPLRVGDRINVVDEVSDISEEKTTRLGTGHFITTESRYRRQDGTLVARAVNVMLRYFAD